MSDNHYDVIIIGAGPAGLMAAIQCYSPSLKILILEKMHQPAIKLKISGKGRCNITNAAEYDTFLQHFGPNGRFLKFAFKQFFNTALLDFLKKRGLKIKLERGGRYFPENDKAIDVVNILLDQIRKFNIPLTRNCQVSDLSKTDNGPFLLNIQMRGTERNKFIGPMQFRSDHIILATGGRSYPKTGSDGSGYPLAARLGHTIKPTTPSLVPLKTRGTITGKLDGLVLKNVRSIVWAGGKKIDEQFGEMIFTETGISGPIILSMSNHIVRKLNEKQDIKITIDLKPALDHPTLDRRLLREISTHRKKQFSSLLKNLLPKRMIDVFIDLLNVPEDKALNELTLQERKKLKQLLKAFPLEVSGYGYYDEAIMTAGGISIKEINPNTMESKLTKGLYFAGEVMDIDADTGGYNLQAAFSTGWIAGQAVKAACVK